MRRYFSVRVRRRVVDTLEHSNIGPNVVFEILELYIPSVRRVRHHRRFLSVRASRRPSRRQSLSSSSVLCPSVPSYPVVAVVPSPSARPVVVVVRRRPSSVRPSPSVCVLCPSVPSASSVLYPSAPSSVIITHMSV